MMITMMKTFQLFEDYFETKDSTYKDKIMKES